MSATASLPSGGRRDAFTLLEVLVTIALIALLTGVLVVGTNRLLGDRPKTADELFRAAVNETRHDALLHYREVRLAFDAKKNEFVALDADGGETRHPFVPKDTGEIDFLPPRPAGGSSPSSVLIGGQLVETQTLPFVTFYRDGTCTPFRAQIKSRNGIRFLEIDPWTCAPMLANSAAR